MIVEVHGISNLDKKVVVHCANSGNKQGNLLLCQSLMKYLMLQDRTPLWVEIYQQGLIGQVNMVIPNPNTPEVEARFEMFNKQPAIYLYHILQSFVGPPTQL